VLLITPDVFPGRPNPSALLTDSAEARATLTELLRDRSLLADGPAADARLGLRGITIELTNDELASDFGLSDRLFVPGDVVCQIELRAFNRGFWNNDANVRLHNNCYNYASTKRTNTFAQPGRGCGHKWTGSAIEDCGCGLRARSSPWWS
jgi:hypothetical protein